MMSVAKKVVSLEDHKEKVMGNPQLEDGYVRIANELFAAMAAFGFTGRQMAVLMIIISKTYGYNKKSDQIGLSQFRDLTGLERKHVSLVLKELADMNIVSISGEGFHARIISINKNYTSWVSPKKGQSPIKGLSPKEVEKYPQTRDTPIPKLGTTKDSIKDNTKDSVNAPEQNAVSSTEKRSAKSKGIAALPEPDFGGDELKKAWGDFVAHRAGMKKPLTVLSANKNINVLREADKTGFCPVALCDKAISSGWQGIFAPKQGDKRKEIQFSTVKTLGGMKAGKNWV